MGESYRVQPHGMHSCGIVLQMLVYTHLVLCKIQSTVALLHQQGDLHRRRLGGIVEMQPKNVFWNIFQGALKGAELR